MPEKLPQTRRWGGPGSSHENAHRDPPDPTVKDPDDPDHFSRHSQVSTGGGERDVHRRHDAMGKRRKQAGEGEKSHER